MIDEEISLINLIGALIILLLFLFISWFSSFEVF